MGTGTTVQDSVVLLDFTAWQLSEVSEFVITLTYFLLIAVKIELCFLGRQISSFLVLWTTVNHYFMQRMGVGKLKWTRWNERNTLYHGIQMLTKSWFENCKPIRSHVTKEALRLKDVVIELFGSMRSWQQPQDNWLKTECIMLILLKVVWYGGIMMLLPVHVDVHYFHLWLMGLNN